MTVTITVPENATEEIYNKICDGFRKKYGDDITFLKETDDSIIGGFIAEANGTVSDTTVRAKLDEIKRIITE